MIAAHYFDGHSSRPQPVWVEVDTASIALYSAPQAQLPHGDPLRSEPLSSIRVSERWAKTARLIQFNDGAYIELENSDALNQTLNAVGLGDRPVARWQQSWRWTFMGALVILLCTGMAYFWAIPWISQTVAEGAPEVWAEKLSAPVIDTLEEHALKPSLVPKPQQVRIETAFRAWLRDEPNLPSIKLLFRDSPKIGANAFALPDGTILVTDQLIKLADNDLEVLAVLAHELGHVKHKHGMRMVLQSSLVGAMAAWYFGDVSSILAGGSTALLEGKYSRTFEFEADDFGAQLLRRHHLEPRLLADMLNKLEANAEQPQLEKNKEQDRSDGVWELLASHPETQARVERLLSK